MANFAFQYHKFLKFDDYRSKHPRMLLFTKHSLILRLHCWFMLQQQVLLLILGPLPRSCSSSLYCFGCCCSHIALAFLQLLQVLLLLSLGSENLSDASPVTPIGI
eukprot:TRINITY_DN25128_c0_g1_i1.p1 TRINITY_DN25128_c0_g1~~TRINITY_DN25128_c0_g1_i1.p1  ORF type:complete len:105 (-),score=3.95 TRINITY_DN25128_c0_g1_i1:260-574(-)